MVWSSLPLITVFSSGLKTTDHTDPVCPKRLRFKANRGNFAGGVTDSVEIEVESWEENVLKVVAITAVSIMRTTPPNTIRRVGWNSVWGIEAGKVNRWVETEIGVGIEPETLASARGLER